MLSSICILHRVEGDFFIGRREQRLPFKASSFDVETSDGQHPKGRIEGYTTCGTLEFDTVCIMSSTPCLMPCAYCGCLNHFDLATRSASCQFVKTCMSGSISSRRSLGEHGILQVCLCRTPVSIQVRHEASTVYELPFARPRLDCTRRGLRSHKTLRLIIELGGLTTTMSITPKLS
jgi:hypothetical protein